MTAKKYQFYIDNITQDNYCYKKITARKLNINDINLLDKDSNFEELMSTVTEYTVNTQNLFFKEFCIENNIAENIYNKILRKYNEINLSFWGLTNIKDLSEYTVFGKQNRLFITFYEKNISSSIPFIIKITNKKWASQDRLINYGTDLIISENILNNSQKLNSKYRLYLNDRLLVERFYPEDLPRFKIICEECYLDLNQPVKIKLETDCDLIITKSVSNNNTAYPNSKEFILEP